jgi:hypothetical protein
VVSSQLVFIFFGFWFLVFGLMKNLSEIELFAKVFSLRPLRLCGEKSV